MKTSEATMFIILCVCLELPREGPGSRYPIKRNRLSCIPQRPIIQLSCKKGLIPPSRKPTQLPHVGTK